MSQGIGSRAVGPEELAIVGLMEAIFDLADKGAVFINRLKSFQSRANLPNVFHDLGAIHPMQEKVRWLVTVIRSQVEKEAIQYANAESRQSVSSIIKVCTFELKYLTNRIFVAAESSLSQKMVLLSLFGKRKDILQRVQIIDAQARDLSHLLEYLNSVRPTPEIPPAVSNPPTSLIPRVPCNDFIGRDKYLNDLSKQMTKTGMVAFEGPPGIGKSEVCLQYARKLQDMSLVKWIFWIDGTNPMASFTTIAKYLRLSTREDPANAVLHWMKKSDEQSLIIVDDVNPTEQMDYTSNQLLKWGVKDSKDFGAYGQALKPVNALDKLEDGESAAHPHSRGNLLIFSKALVARPSILRDLAVRFRPIQPLDAAEASKLLRELIPSAMVDFEDHYRQIIKLVGYLPANIKQAANYIKHTGLTTSQYITGYGKLHGSTQFQRSQLKMRTSSSSDEDIQSAAIKISQTFLANETFKSMIEVLKKSKIPTDDIVKAVESSLCEYAHELQSPGATTPQSKNALPAFILENFKRITHLIIPRVSYNDTDVPSFLPPRRQSTTSTSNSGQSRRSSIKSMALSGMLSRRNSIRPQYERAASRVTLTDTARQQTVEESKRLEQFYFDERAFGRLMINILDYAGSFQAKDISGHRPRVLSNLTPEDLSSLMPLILDAYTSATTGKGILTVTYNIEWELPAVLEMNFPEDQHLSDVVAIVGGQDDAQAVTIGEYVRHFWDSAMPLLYLLDSTNWGRENGVSELAGVTISLKTATSRRTPAKSILEALEESVAEEVDISACDKKEKTEEKVKPEGSPKKNTTTSDASLVLKSQTHTHALAITVEGPEDIQADIAQTLAWLTAAIRHSDVRPLQTSQASMGFRVRDKNLTVAITPTTLKTYDRSDTSSSCWHDLFAHGVVATGYKPSRPKPHDRLKGLDIPANLMVSLARTTIMTEHQGHGHKGFVIQSFQYILIPVEVMHLETPDNPSLMAVQWHLIDASRAEVDPGIADIRSVAKTIKALASFLPGVESSTKDLSYPENQGKLKEVRTFLGWCHQIKITIGTDVQAQHPATETTCCTMPYPDPRERLLNSNARKAGRAKTISAINASVGGGANGATAGVGIVGAIGERRDALVLERIGTLESQLHGKAKQNLILYDTETRRAYMLPYLYVLLHLVHLRERATTSHSEHLNFPLPFSAQRYSWAENNTESPAWDAIRPHLELLTTVTVNRKRLARAGAQLSEQQRRVKIAMKLVDHLEYLLTVLSITTKQSVTWRSKEMAFFHSSIIYGFEMGEISYSDTLAYKQQKLRHTSGGWAKLRRGGEQVLFCKGIGDAILPISLDERLCRQCLSLPTDFDYLAAPISSLSTCPHAEKRDLTSFKIRTNNNRPHEWDIQESHLSEPCPENNGQDQGTWHRKTTRLSFLKRSTTFIDFTQYMQGAVIFGRRTRSSAIKSGSAAIKKWATKLASRNTIQSPAATVLHREHLSATELRGSQDRENGSTARTSSSIEQPIRRASPTLIIEPPTIPGAHTQPEQIHIPRSSRAQQTIPTASTSSRGRNTMGSGSHAMDDGTTISRGTTPGTTPENSPLTDGYAMERGVITSGNPVGRNGNAVRGRERPEQVDKAEMVRGAGALFSGFGAGQERWEDDGRRGRGRGRGRRNMRGRRRGGG